MGKLTTLYAVDIDDLVSAVGSGNEDLLSELRRLVPNSTEVSDTQKLPLTSDFSGDVSLRVTQDGRIYFRGIERTLEQVCFDLIKVSGGTIEFIIETPWSERHDEIIRTTNEVIPRSGIERVVTRFASDDPSVDTTPNVTWSREESDECGMTAEGPTFQVSPQALSDLVYGRLETCGAEHLRALEVICFVTGMKLPDDQMLGELQQLQFETPLERPRCPVPIPCDLESPVVSYLDSTEVLEEAHRLSRLGSSFSGDDDEDVEESRETFMMCMRQAAIEGLGVVSFTQ